MKKMKKILRLTRYSSGNKAGRPRILVVDVEKVDGVVIEPSGQPRTQVLMMNGSTIYVREDPDEILTACEAMGCAVGVFTKAGAKEAMNDCIE